MFCCRVYEPTPVITPSPRIRTSPECLVKFYFSWKRADINGVCEKHFREECFSNLGQYEGGLAGRLRLAEGQHLKHIGSLCDIM
ncbi:hypothetical protein CHARACLAT_010105 [Characodon lateralis]|uniref:Uncharacterized protein n=1 Tax=Characodon lateralis TaxID=208331 RepID=A0ABU7E0X0_9TELE|nr:hypothetical protein [Characodon lateralis]